MKVVFANGRERHFKDELELAKFLLFGMEGIIIPVTEKPKLPMTAGVIRLLKMKRKILLNRELNDSKPPFTV